MILSGLVADHTIIQVKNHPQKINLSTPLRKDYNNKNYYQQDMQSLVHTYIKYTMYYECQVQR